MKQIKKNIIFLTMIILFISIAILSYLRSPLTYSSYEQRTLQTFPSISTDFGKELNTYTNDQFYFRNEFMNLKSKLQLMLGQRKINGVWVCDDILYQEGVGLSSLQKEKLITHFQMFQEKSKIKPMMMIIGDRINLLSDDVKDDMLTVDSLKDIQDLQKGLKDYHFIDVNSSLMQQKDAFYQSDHHYNSKGAYLCFEKYHQEILTKEPKVEYDIYPLTNQFQGTLASQSGVRSFYDLVELYLPKKDDVQYYVQIDENQYSSIYQLEKGLSQNAYEVFLGGNHPLVEIKTNVSNQKHLLIVKDSFANAFVPFLLPYYHRITMVDPRYYYDNIYPYMKEEKVNEVLFLYSSQTLFQDTSIFDFINMQP